MHYLAKGRHRLFSFFLLLQELTAIPSRKKGVPEAGLSEEGVSCKIVSCEVSRCEVSEVFVRIDMKH